MFSVSRIHRRAHLESTTRTQRHEEEQNLQAPGVERTRFLRVLSAILRDFVVTGVRWFNRRPYHKGHQGHEGAQNFQTLGVADPVK